MSALVLPKTARMSCMESQVEDGSREEEIKVTKRKIALFNCTLCGSEEAKYTCPRCLTHSCSLQCVKKHKDDTGCSGVRDKTAFVALSRFDEMTLLSDYRFLEDTGRFSDGATRDTLVRIPHATKKARRLTSVARQMNITLKFLPCTFTKSKENSTFYISKEKRFMWHLKLVFPQSSAEFSLRRVSDQLTLNQILTPYIHPTKSDPVKRQRLKMYVHEPLDHVKVFMKAEGRKANSVRYHELDLHKSLKDNLGYKTLIEYPVLYVVLNDHWCKYPLKGLAEESSSVQRTTHQKVDNPTCLPKKCMESSEISPDLGPPQMKRAKQETTEDDREEGEITESSDEEESSSSDENSKASKSPVKDMEKSGEKVADSVDIVDSHSCNNHSNSSREMCRNEDITPAPDGTQSPEVSVTQACPDLPLS